MFFRDFVGGGVSGGGLCIYRCFLGGPLINLFLLHSIYFGNGKHSGDISIALHIFGNEILIVHENPLVGKRRAIPAQLGVPILKRSGKCRFSRTVFPVEEVDQGGGKSYVGIGGRIDFNPGDMNPHFILHFHPPHH
jgi:hypothetical protein